MRRIGRIARALMLGLGLGMSGGMAIGQGPPPPPPPPPPPGPGQPFASLSPSELSRWQNGKGAFNQPASVPGGLGPVFNEASCVLCHGGAGLPSGSSGTELVTRFGRVLNGQFDPMIAFGGPSIQAKGIGKFNGVNFVGEVVPAQATIVAHRRTAPLFGLGLVDAVPDPTLMFLAAEQEKLSPATAGVVSLVVDPASGQERVGRFGWKAQEASLFSFAADALVNEMGVTTPVFPTENAPQGNAAILAANPALNHPNQTTNIQVQQLNDFVTFNAPPPKGQATAATQVGQLIFGTIGCANCHQPTLQAGPSSSTSISGVVFAPFSDFLLHDMGTLGDGLVQGSAGPAQMRTAPLWGLRFETTLLHDGRATTVDQAIRAHAGQGATAAHNYTTLTPTQQSQLLAFLNTL